VFDDSNAEHFGLSVQNQNDNYNDKSPDHKDRCNDSDPKRPSDIIKGGHCPRLALPFLVAKP